MLKVTKDRSFEGMDIPFGLLEVRYPEPARWEQGAFQALKERELPKISALAASYDRRAVFGENAHYRYFKKFKKSYPVMMQLESFLLKGRPFPQGEPINEVVFLAELGTRFLMGAHDVDKIRGGLTLFRPEEKVPFEGLGGREAHVYPRDLSGRDEEGIIFGMIAGADSRTCLSAGSRHVAYLFFGVEGMPAAPMEGAMDRVTEYVSVLAPSADIRRAVF